MLLQSSFITFLVLFNIGTTQAQLGGSTPQVKFELPVVEKLENGMNIAWFINDKLPLADIIWVAKSGYRDDPIPGICTMTISLLDRGAQGKSALEIAKEIEQLGAKRWGSCDEDTLTVGIRGLSSDSSTLLDILSKLILKPDFTQKEFDREKERMLDSWLHLDDTGAALTSVAFQRLTTLNTPYGLGGFNSAQALKSIKRSDVQNFYKAHFVPSNSLLVVIGRANKEQIKAQLNTLFGSWKGSKPTRKTVLKSDPRISRVKSKYLMVDRAGLTQAQVRIGFKTISFQNLDRYPLSVGNAMLGEYFQSRLNAELRDKLGLTYGVSSQFVYSLDLGRFILSSATRNENVGVFLKTTMEILKKFKNEPVPTTLPTQKEVEMAKDYLLGGFPLSHATPQAISARWMTGYIFGMGPDYLNEYVPNIERLTPDQVIQAAKKHFKLDELLVVVGGDGKAIEKSLDNEWKKKFKKITVRDLR